LLFQIALKPVEISLRIYTHRFLLDWPVERFSKLVGIPDDFQRLKALESLPNLARHYQSYWQDFTGVLETSLKADQNLSQVVSNLALTHSRASSLLQIPSHNKQWGHRESSSWASPSLSMRSTSTNSTRIIIHASLALAAW